MGEEEEQTWFVTFAAVLQPLRTEVVPIRLFRCKAFRFKSKWLRSERKSIRSFVANYKYVLGSLVRRCPVPFNFPSNFLLFFWRKRESYEVGLKNLETTFQADTENQTEILILKLSDCKCFSGTNWLFRRRKRRLFGTKRFRLGTKWRGRKWTPRVITILKASISSSWSEKKVRTTI